MNCAEHPESPATAYCRECGKPMCEACQRPAQGSIYCETHAAAFASPGPPPAQVPVLPPPVTASFAESPYSAPATPGGQPVQHANPVLALILGLTIPGLGAIYNGQYAKGLIHAVVSGLLISLISSGRAAGMEVVAAIFLAAWWVYMGVEAYHTARKRRYGIDVDEFSSLFETRAAGGRFPMGAVVLIGLGFILLLDTTDIINLDQLERFWPLGLILLGVYLLYARLHSGEETNKRNGEVRR